MLGKHAYATAAAAFPKNQLFPDTYVSSRRIIMGNQVFSPIQIGEKWILIGKRRPNCISPNCYKLGIEKLVSNWKRAVENVEEYLY